MPMQLMEHVSALLGMSDKCDLRMVVLQLICRLHWKVATLKTSSSIPGDV